MITHAHLNGFWQGRYAYEPGEDREKGGSFAMALRVNPFGDVSGQYFSNELGVACFVHGHLRDHRLLLVIDYPKSPDLCPCRDSDGNPSTIAREFAGEDWERMILQCRELGPRCIRSHGASLEDLHGDIVRLCSRLTYVGWLTPQRTLAGFWCFLGGEIPWAMLEFPPEQGAWTAVRYGDSSLATHIEI